jgi:hypothetical protein
VAGEPPRIWRSLDGQCWITLDKVCAVHARNDEGQGWSLQAQCEGGWLVPIGAEEAAGFVAAYQAGQDRRVEATVQLYELLAACGEVVREDNVVALLARAKELIALGRKYEYLESNRRHLEQVAAEGECDG